MKSNKGLHMIAYLLLIIGGLNWLLLGIFGWEIGMIFGGSMALVSRIIYILVGVAAIYELLTHKTHCTHCRVAQSREPAPAPENQG